MAVRRRMWGMKPTPTQDDPNRPAIGMEGAELPPKFDPGAGMGRWERPSMAKGGDEGANKVPTGGRSMEGFDYDGYAPPAWLPEGDFGGAMAGWDAGKWNNQNYWSPKYTVGRLMSRYGTGDEFENMLKQVYPNARLEGDRLFFGDDPNFVDIFQDEEGARTPQWYVPSMDQGAGGIGGGQWGTGGSGPFGGPFGGGGHYSGSGSGTTGGSSGRMWQYIEGILNGGWNQNVVDARVKSAQEVFDRQRKGMLAQDRAELANRGIGNMGPELTALANMDSELAGQFGTTVRDIYADQADIFSDTINNALGQGVEYDLGSERNKIGWEQLGLDRDLGFGQLGLGYDRLGLDRLQSDRDYDLGLGRLGLDRDQLAWMMENGGIDQIMRIIELISGGN